MAVLVLTNGRFEDPRPGLHAVFANTGGEWPETYAYLDRLEAWLAAHGVPLHRVRAPKPLYEHCLDRSVIPTRRFRRCTDYAKIRPIRKFARQVIGLPVTMLLGFDAGELRRTLRVGCLPAGIQHRYPLQEAGLDRQGCADLLRAHALPVPRKSGCTFCPFASAVRFVELHDAYPELWEQAVALEARASRRRLERGKPPIWLHQDDPLSALLDRREEILARARRRPALPGKGTTSLIRTAQLPLLSR